MTDVQVALAERVGQAEHDFPLLAALARTMALEGYRHADVLTAYEARRALADAAGREGDCDNLCDVMDHIVGFCSPHNNIVFADDPPLTEDTRRNAD